MMKRKIPSFAKLKVLVVGDLLADHYVYGQTDRVSREAPVLIVQHEREEVKLGGAGNVAANAKALGAQVAVLGYLGRDAIGREMERLFERQSISVRAVRTLHSEQRTRILAGGLNTTRQQMLRIDRSLASSISAASQRQLANSLRKELRQADVVMLSDYGAGVSNEATRQVLTDYALAGGLLCVDSRSQLRLLTGASVCKPNEPELQSLTGLPLNSSDELEVAGRMALGLLKCRLLLVTRGRNGMSLFEQGSTTKHLPVHGVADAVDVTGAGDTVLAAFSVALAAGMSGVAAAQLANIAGALVVQKQGTATVSREEIENSQ